MSNFDDIAQSWGVQPITTTVKKVDAKNLFYEHALGDYEGFVIEYKERWVNEAGKAAEPQSAGSKGNGLLRIALIKDTVEALTDANLQYKSGEPYPYGRLVYNVFITFEPTQQFQNRNLFKDFYIEGAEGAAVITGDKDYSVNLQNLAFYMGARVNFTLTKTTKKGEAKRAFIDEKGIILLSHKLDKDLYARRQQAIGLLKQQLDERREKEEKENKNTEAAPEVNNAANDVFSQFEQVP